jgi:hypothetical protein
VLVYVVVPSLPVCVVVLLSVVVTVESEIPVPPLLDSVVVTVV